MTGTGTEAAARRAWLAGVPAALLVGLAIWEALSSARARAPGDPAWSRAAAIVRAGHRPGDLIVFAPGWVGPVGRLHLGDLIPIAMAARMDAARYGRIWELAIRGARAPETAGLEPVETHHEGGVAVRRYERPPAVIAADLLELLPSTRIEGTPARSPTIELAEVGFEPHRCVQIVPNPNQPVRITYPKLPAGKLVGYVGLADVFTRRDERRPGTLAVVIAGEQVVSVTAGVDDGWLGFSTWIAEGDDVTLVLASEGPGRMICFAAEVRR